MCQCAIVPFGKFILVTHKLYIVNSKIVNKIMIKQGFIKEVCEPRTFTDKEGKLRSAYPVVCDFPYMTQSGKEVIDEIVAELYADNPAYVEQVKQLAQQNKRCELTIYLSVSMDSNGRKWQRIKLNNIKQTLEG